MSNNAFPRRSVLYLPALLLLAPSAYAGDGLFMLLNARNPTSSVSRGEAKNIFTGKTAFWHGVVPVKLFTRPGDSAPGKAFYEPVLGMSPQAFAQHWNKLQLAGKGIAPPEIGSATELAKKIAQVPGGIGFVIGSEAWALDGVKIVELK